MEIDLPAQLYTSYGKFSTSVTLNDIAGMISFFDPARRETYIVGRDCRLILKHRGWFLSDFYAVDLLNSPPLWQQKLTLYKSDGDKLIQALTAWQ